MKTGYALSKLRFKKVIDLTACAVIDQPLDDDEFINIASFLESGDKDFQRENCETYADVIRASLAILLKSPSAGTMVRDAGMAGWSISLCSQNAFDFTLDLDEKIISLDHSDLEAGSLAASEHFLSAMMISMVKALRDVWQQKRNSGYENMFNPESILLLERIRAADSCILAVLVAWELRSEGFPGLWRTMIGSDYGDLALSFSGTLEREPSSAFTQHALSHTFRQWFRDDARVAACDHETLDMMDGLLALDKPHTFGKKAPTHICVELFSCLPDRTAYLRGDGAEILRNPFFCGLGDPVNQTHLFQILHDSQAHYAGGVAFRDAGLAAMIFPQGRNNAELEEEVTRF